MLTALGLMSGTSMDGIDIALLKTNGEIIESFGPTQFTPYPIELRNIIEHALIEAKQIQNRFDRPGQLSHVEGAITKAHIEAIKSFLSNQRISVEALDIIGFHGQTVRHDPEKSLTIQLGIGPQIHKFFGVPVVYDLRAHDVENGGQGAPLVPVYHTALADFSRIPRPAVIVNIGGVANVTWIGHRGELLAFDTGPGNALIDDWVNKHTGKLMDIDGLIAGAGRVNQDRLATLMRHPFFDIRPPKSLDRGDFNYQPVERLSLEDGAATLTAFTAHSLASSIKHMPEFPRIWVLTGGGVSNPVFCGMFKHAIQNYGVTEVRLAHELGWNTNFIEAQAFAYLATRSMKKYPITFPGTTGVEQPLSGGVVVTG